MAGIRPSESSFSHSGTFCSFFEKSTVVGSYSISPSCQRMSGFLLLIVLAVNSRMSDRAISELLQFLGVQLFARAVDAVDLRHE